MPSGFRKLMTNNGYPQLLVIYIRLISQKADSDMTVLALAVNIFDHLIRDRMS